MSDINHNTLQTDAALESLTAAIEGQDVHNFDPARRHILGAGLAGFLGACLPLIGSGQAMAAKTATRRVAFRNAHTGESFSGVYRVGDRYLPEAFERINYVLRDFRTGEIFPMDPHVVDILAAIHDKRGSHKPFEILSGYRSPKTNRMLRRATTASGVAQNSYHMYGQAVDVRLPGTRTKTLRNTAIQIKAGGVGYYPKSNFVHMDTGKVRSW